MKLIVINGSPKPGGAVAKLLDSIVEGAGESIEATRLEVSRLRVAPCTGCMSCRPDKPCILAEDDAHRVAGLFAESDAVVIGTPTYWANMSGSLKVLLDRVVTAFIHDSAAGSPKPLHKGKPAVIVTACSTPRLWDRIAKQSGGATSAVSSILRLAGFRILGTVAQPGMNKLAGPTDAAIAKARLLGARVREAHFAKR